MCPFISYVSTLSISVSILYLFLLMIYEKHEYWVMKLETWIYHLLVPRTTLPESNVHNSAKSITYMFCHHKVITAELGSFSPIKSVMKYIHTAFDRSQPADCRNRDHACIRLIASIKPSADTNFQKVGCLSQKRAGD